MLGLQMREAASTFLGMQRQELWSDLKFRKFDTAGYGTIEALAATTDPVCPHSFSTLDVTCTPASHPLSSSVVRIQSTCKLTRRTLYSASLNTCKSWLLHHYRPFNLLNLQCLAFSSDLPAAACQHVRRRIFSPQPALKAGAAEEA